MREILEKEPNLRILQAEVAQLSISDGRVTGVLLRDGRSIESDAVVVTTGTFLNGLAHVGEAEVQLRPKRRGAVESARRSAADLGAGVEAAEDGTPPRLDGRTIDWSRFEPQSGDADPTPFSFLTARIDRRASPLLYCIYDRGDASRFCARASPGRRCIAGRSKASARVIVRRSRTRSSSSRTNPGIRFFWSRKVWTRMKFMSMGCRPACRSTSRREWSRRFPGWSRRR